MTKAKRPRFTAAFNNQALGRLDLPEATLSGVAGELGVTATQLKAWRLEKAAAGSAEALAQRKAEAAEIAQLRRENKRLREEVEIMRKTSAFFSVGGEKRWRAIDARHLLPRFQQGAKFADGLERQIPSVA